MPTFVVGEFRKFLRCGDCAFERLVPFSIEDPAVIRRILTRLGLSMEGGKPVPAWAPAEAEDSPA